MRFEPIEGLRGYLALWVAAGHAMQFTVMGQHLGPLDPTAAVQSFMIVSGFVITHLVLAKDERYQIYIMRRFFRLFPAYVVCIGISWFIVDQAYLAPSSLPWSKDPAFAPYIQRYRFRALLVDMQPIQHLFAHISMLHGAIPPKVLPEAARTILTPAWSISLEWQFYIIAPLIIALMRRSRGVLIVCASIIAGIIFSRASPLGRFDEGFIAFSGYFLVIGVASRIALPRIAAISFDPFASGLFICICLVLLTRSPLGLVPWAIIYPFLVAEAAGKKSKFLHAVLANPLSLWVGKISYSIYLTHFIILVLLVKLAVTIDQDVSQISLIVILLTGISATIAASAALYYAVERPSIILARYLARSMQKH